MRGILSISFLAIYLTLAFLRPLAPFVYYAANKAYITEEFCENKDKPQLKCDGKCYLRAQLAESYNITLQEESPAPKDTQKEARQNWNRNLMFEHVSSIKQSHTLVQYYHILLTANRPLINKELGEDLCDLDIAIPPPRV